MILTVLNIVFPGSALLWRKQTLQGIAYAASFGFLSAFRQDVGAVGAIFVWILAQIHFQRVRVVGSEKGLGRTAKLLVWLLTILVLALFFAAYGPSARHFAGYPVFIVVVICLAVPALLLTLWLEPKPQTA